VNTVPTLLAKGAYIPEQGYDSMDLSMPQYRVEALDDLKTTTTTDASVPSAERSVSSSSSGPSRAEQGAIAVAQAKAKKAAAKAEAMAKREAWKQEGRTIIP
jgi:putative intracellular protease/amidase